MIEEMKKEFLEKFAVHCSDVKGEWYGWMDIDTPLTVWQWIETKIDEAWGNGYNEAVDTHARITQVQLDEACKKQRVIYEARYEHLHNSEETYETQKSYIFENAPSPKENT